MDRQACLHQRLICWDSVGTFNQQDIEWSSNIRIFTLRQVHCVTSKIWNTMKCNAIIVVLVGCVSCCSCCNEKVTRVDDRGAVVECLGVPGTHGHTASRKPVEAINAVLQHQRTSLIGPAMPAISCGTGDMIAGHPVEVCDVIKKDVEVILCAGHRVKMRECQVHLGTIVV